MKLIDAGDLALQLMKIHGIQDWNFEFDNAKRRFGCCNYQYEELVYLNI